MVNFSLKASARQGPADFIGNHYRAMLSPGTAEGDGEVALSLANVMRQQKDQQLREQAHKLGSLWKRTDVPCNTRVFSGEVLESRNVIGIGKKPDVKNQIAIRRNAVAEAEAGDVDLYGGVIALPAEPLPDKIAQLVDGEPGSIDDEVRHGANGCQLRALALDAA